MATRLRSTRTLTLDGTSIPASDLYELLADVVAQMREPEVSFSLYRAGNDPREHDYVTITITEAH